ncbi:hypothetical protein, partial [Pseudomonas brassicacearum]|uniref:hypothetical protein n=1 Tax=Pseudomonas brassicacearum TaxID=930166 RepID=UPI0016125A84
MEINDDVEVYDFGGSSTDPLIIYDVEKDEAEEGSTIINPISLPTGKDVVQNFKSILEVVNSGFFGVWAQLEIEYTWNTSSFTCKTSRYRVINIGQSSGNIIFGFSSKTSWSDREITNDNAIQDGRWHTIVAGGTVASNATQARIYFKYKFDIKDFLDPWASVEKTLKFISPPTIINPGVVWTAKPTLRGTGVAGSTVKLYESGVGTILFGTATVNSDKNWTAPLIASLWQADPFPFTASQTLDGKTSDWATPVSFAVLFKPVISTPITVSADGKPTISGTGGLKDATLEIWLQGGAGGVQLTTTVRANGTWSVSATTAWTPGTYSITARQIGKVTKQSSDWADHKTFAVKPLKPAITPPPNPAAAKQVLTITGV